MLLHCHCERPTGACLHAEVLSFACLRGAASAKAGQGTQACLHAEVLSFSTQAWQSHLINKRLLRRFTPRNDALLNAFVLNYQCFLYIVA
jgi:hypothetical protein